VENVYVVCLAAKLYTSYSVVQSTHRILSKTGIASLDNRMPSRAPGSGRISSSNIADEMKAPAQNKGTHQILAIPHYLPKCSSTYTQAGIHI